MATKSANVYARTILVKTLSLYYKTVTLYEKLYGALDSFVKKV